MRIWSRYLVVAMLVLFSLQSSLFGETENTITVLTYNIHHGEGMDRKLDLERIAGVILSAKPDLVALQEVDQDATRSGRVDQAKELGRLCGMHHVFGKAMGFQGGAYGQAVLSRWPILTSSVHQLPQRSGREPRIALAVAVSTPATSLRFVSTHLDHEIEEIRLDQVKELNSLFGQPGKIPVLLAGDFNATPGSKPIEFLSKTWTDSSGPNAAPTIPAEKPNRRIDYIFFSSAFKWQVTETRVLEESVASDHRPVLSTLRFDGLVLRNK